MASLNVRRRRRAEHHLSQQAVELAVAIAPSRRPTSHCREHEARQQTEAHLRQAQKMEAVGRLAGGIAHDVDNLLTIIIGSRALLLQGRPGVVDSRDAIDQIRQASEQAATRTQNLLAFSRRQLDTPVVVDVAAVLTTRAPMLARFCGESLTLALALDTEAGRVDLGDGNSNRW